MNEFHHNTADFEGSKQFHSVNSCRFVYPAHIVTVCWIVTWCCVIIFGLYIGCNVKKMYKNIQFQSDRNVLMLCNT